MFRDRDTGIRKKLLSVVLFPIIILSILTTIAGVILFSGVYTKSIRDELVSTTGMMLDCLDFAVQGDYAYVDGVLMKGDLNITNSTMLLRIKMQSQIDTTIFWQDTRVLTTIEDAHGVSAVGTIADPEIVERVYFKGEKYFPDHLRINGVRYIGYYVPLENPNGDNVGMIFAGKKKVLVYREILKAVFWFVFFSMAVIFISLSAAKGVSARMIKDINLINRFLKEISEGNLRVELDGRIKESADEFGTIGLYAAIMRDNLRKLIEMDALTGLYNRRSAHLMLDEIVESKEIYSVIMCDIDLFKRINDTYGHDGGDYVLKELSALIQNNVSKLGFASRWGGEEFLLVFRMDFELAKEAARQLQQSIWDHRFIYKGIDINVTMTFGIAMGRETCSYEQIIKEADEKLYVGKNNGRNQIVF